MFGVRCSSTSEQANEFNANQMINPDTHALEIQKPCVYVLQHGVDCRTCKSNNVIIDVAAAAAAVFINAKLLHQNHRIQSISLVCGNFFAHTPNRTQTHAPVMTPQKIILSSQNFWDLFYFSLCLLLSFFVAHFSFSRFKMRERNETRFIIISLL